MHIAPNPREAIGISPPERRPRRPPTAQLVLLGSLFATSCGPIKTVGPDYELPTTELPSAFKFESFKNGKPAARRKEWWKVYRDPDLNRLIEQVRGSNQEIRAAIARFDQAQASLLGANAAFGPSVGGSPSVIRRRTSDEVNFGGTLNTVFTTPVSASWEIDLFGRLRRNAEAFQADAQASGEALIDLSLALEAQAATGYFTLRALDSEIAIVENELGSRQDSLQLARDRFELGATSRLDVSRAESELAANRADLADLRRQRIVQETALATLAGQIASHFSIPSSPLQGKSPNIPASLPSELLRARPDIRAAERKVAAANARVGVAETARYPSLSLTGSAGYSSNFLNSLVSKPAAIWSIGPELTVPIFSSGRNKANLDLTKAQYTEILADYQQTVLESLSEVESRLAATRQLEIQDEAQRAAVKSSRDARQTARDQYNGGLIDYLAVLDTERTTLTAERSQAVLLGSEFINSVNLIRALGGRW